MDLLNKFNTVEVDNSSRIPNDLREKLDAVYSNYKSALIHNERYLEDLGKFVSGEVSHDAQFLSYYSSTDSMIISCKTKIRNLKYQVLNIFIKTFNSKYNMVLSTDDVLINGKKSTGLSTQTHYDYRNDSKELSWDDIQSYDPNVKEFVDFVFKMVGFSDLNDVVKQESISYLYSMYNEDSYRSDLQVAKNGSITLPSFLSNPSSHHNTDNNKRALKSLNILLGLWSETKGLTLSENFKPNTLFSHFEIGTYYSGYRTTKMFEKVEGENLVEYMQHFQNGKFKLKLKNYAEAHDFLVFSGLLK